MKIRYPLLVRNCRIITIPQGYIIPYANKSYPHEK